MAGKVGYSTLLTSGSRATMEPCHPGPCSSSWVTERPAADLSVPSLAARAGLSPRQFARSFVAETGMTPGRYVDRVRLDAARRELEDTGAGVEQVARSCGYGTPEAMRRAFIWALGLSPAGYRQRFQARPRPAIHRKP
jgi:transcriptional regulator GlxA family with amidase domain